LRSGVDELALVRDEHRYVSHPHMVRLTSGAWLLIANCAPRRRFTMHPPQDPEFFNILISSSDEGRHWSAPRVVPGYGWTGMECAGLTSLGNNAVMMNQWQFRWYPSDSAPSRSQEPMLRDSEALRRSLLDSSELDVVGLAEQSAEREMPWARGGGRTIIHRSADGGRTWGVCAEVSTTPYSGGYGMRGAIVFENGDIILPLSDCPRYEQIFSVRSSDGGGSWTKPKPVARLSGLAFEEPAPLLLANGTILMLLRENTSRSLYVVRSEDAGYHWSTPEPTGIDCYPAHLVALPDFRIAAVCGCRRPPLGIVAFLSEDGGMNWRLDKPLPIRMNLPNRDLGYPTSVLRSDGSLFTAYYYRDQFGVTGIHATITDVGL
jgi:hypothetical protein